MRRHIAEPLKSTGRQSVTNRMQNNTRGRPTKYIDRNPSQKRHFINLLKKENAKQFTKKKKNQRKLVFSYKKKINSCLNEKLSLFKQFIFALLSSNLLFYITTFCNANEYSL